MIKEINGEKVYFPAGFNQLDGNVHALSERGNALMLFHAKICKNVKATNYDLLLSVVDNSISEPIQVLYPNNKILEVIFEKDDQVSFVGLVEHNVFIARLLWPTIEYQGSTDVSSTGYSFKPDHEQAVLFKCGEKHERNIARLLNEAGFEIPMTPHNGKIVLIKDPSYKRNRKADLKCSKTNLKFEIKSFLKDLQIRVSHSPNRPFSSENSQNDFHVFTRGNEYAIISNQDIIDKWNRGTATSGKYDKYWAFSRGVLPEITIDDLKRKYLSR